MKKHSAPAIVDQVLYNGRMVDRSCFRAFVYNFDGEKLANSYEEYEQLIASGVWYSDKCKILKGHEAPKVEHKSNVEPKQVKRNGANG